MTKLLIALPNPGQMQTDFVMSLVGLTQALSAKRIPFAIKSHVFSDVVMSRNFLMSYFLKQEHFTHKLMLDCDMSFSPDTFFRLLDFDQDFTAAAYTQKNLKIEGLRKLIIEDNEKNPDNPTPTQDLIAANLKYNVMGSIKNGEPWKSKIRGSFRTVPGAGTGFMLLKRAVPEGIVAAGAARRMERQDKLDIYRGSKFHDFFSHLLTSEGNAMLGEDTSFCIRWTKDCGGEIWLDESAEITHHGSYGYRGQANVIKRTTPL